MLMGLALVLNILRVLIYDRYSFVYILWNIFLAFIPYLISSILSHYSYHHKLNQLVFISGGIIWLVFLPNAPYIVTDLIHIGVVRGVPVLFDSILLFTSAWLGLLLGMTSLYQMEKIFLTKYSKKFTVRLIALIILLTSFGMHIGRSFRFNSWDLFTGPFSFFGKLLNILSQSTKHIEALIYTLLFFSFIYVFYQSWKSSQIK